jgi:hypothetical protein
MAKATKEGKETKEVKDTKLEKFKEEYVRLQKKYSTPTFEQLNNYFDIEEISARHSERILRIIRRRITEKTSSYLRFMEVFLNPSQAPLFYMVLAKNLPEEGRKAINEMYFDLGRVEIEHIGMELKDYDEVKEAELIKDFFNVWTKIRQQMVMLVTIFDKQWKQQRAEKRDKTYFG